MTDPLSDGRVTSVPNEPRDNQADGKHEHVHEWLNFGGYGWSGTNAIRYPEANIIRRVGCRCGARWTSIRPVTHVWTQP